VACFSDNRRVPTASPAPAYDLFLSYDHRDKAVATRLRQALAKRDVAVWMDSDEISAGERWGQRLEQGLEASRMFGVIATRASMKSRWVQTEYLSALELAHSSSPDLRLTALVFEEVKLPVILRTFQFVDFRPDFEKAVDALVKGIEAAREQPFTVGDAEVDAAPELQYLKTSLNEESAMTSRLLLVRNVSPAVGLILSALAVVGGAVSPTLEAVALTVAAMLVTGLFGWGATLPLLSASRQRAKKMQFLQSALARCGQSQEPECHQVRVEFWRTFQERPTGP